MTADEFIERNRDQLARNSPFELKFAEDVLRYVEGLDFSRVRPQRPFQDGTGRHRRIDFAIEEGATVRIAIEVDGWDKTGRGIGRTKREFEDDSRREADLSGAGWTVLRFANTLFMREPLNCARNITLVLRRERAKAVAVEALSVPVGEGRDLTVKEADELAGLEQEREAAIRSLERELAKARTQADEMQKVFIAAAVIVVAVVVLAIRLVDQSGTASLPIYPPPAASDPGIPQQSEAPAPAQSESSGSPPSLWDVPGMVTPQVTETIVAPPPDRQVEPTGPAPEPPPFCEGSITWQEVFTREGEVVRVRGPVVGVRYLPSVTGSPTFIDIGRAYPSTRQLSVVIWGRNRPRFDPPPEVAFAEMELCVVGAIRMTGGRPSIELVSPTDVLGTR
jgi:very-short-patch-repair endonuclease